MTRRAFAALVDRSISSYQIPMDVESAGVKSGALGANFENLIACTNAAYNRKQLGLVKKNYPKSKNIGNGRSVYVSKQTVDYDGFLLGVGFCAFDCKSTSEHCWIPAKDQVHQFLYLLTGQRMMPKDQARFFYLIERRGFNDSTGKLFSTSRVYLVEDLEAVKENGCYEFREEDLVREGAGGILIDYREKLISSKMVVRDVA